MGSVQTGLDVVAAAGWKRFEGYRLGLVANQASLDRRLRPAAQVLSERLPGHLKALFGPQHGYAGTEQDNMVETPHSRDQDLRIPVFSLYAKQREPTPAMLALIDIMLVDLQDVGTRVYTFPSTLLNCLRACAREGKKVVVLDRPNPLGGERLEGALLQEQMVSFVGPAPLPMRHGLTMGEMALLFDQLYGLRCDLEIMRLQGWRRAMLWSDTGLRWIMPSPNMPTADTAAVYPGQVIWEGTNVSEGRGTCRPFELCGAPYWDCRAVSRSLDPAAESGCHLQEVVFRPTFQKWKEQVCRGFMLHVLDPEAFFPYTTSLGLLKAVLEVHPGAFQWRPPPYEYETECQPIDLILGDPELRRDLEAGRPLSKLRERWDARLQEYARWRRPFLLYD